MLMRWGRRRGAIRAHARGHSARSAESRAAVRSGMADFPAAPLQSGAAGRRSALALDPRHLASLALRGELLHHLGRWEESKQAYDSALAIDPEMPTHTTAAEPCCYPLLSRRRQITSWRCAGSSR